MAGEGGGQIPWIFGNSCPSFAPEPHGMKSSLEKNLPRPRYFQHNFELKPVWKPGNGEGVLEDGKLACCALACHARGMRDTPRRKPPARQPLGTRAPRMSYLHAAALAQSTGGWIQTTGQEESRFSGSSSQCARPAGERPVVPHPVLWARRSWPGIIKLTEPGWPLPPHPGTFHFVNFRFLLLT